MPREDVLIEIEHRFEAEAADWAPIRNSDTDGRRRKALCSGCTLALEICNEFAAAGILRGNGVNDDLQNAQESVQLSRAVKIEALRMDKFLRDPLQ
jgi:hypothetical protein